MTKILPKPRSSTALTNICYPYPLSPFKEQLFRYPSPLPSNIVDNMVFTESICGSPLRLSRLPRTARDNASAKASTKWPSFSVILWLTILTGLSDARVPKMSLSNVHVRFAECSNFFFVILNARISKSVRLGFWWRCENQLNFPLSFCLQLESKQNDAKYLKGRNMNFVFPQNFQRHVHGMENGVWAQQYSEKVEYFWRSNWVSFRSRKTYEGIYSFT